MSTVHPLYIPTPYQEAADHGRVLLRDGSTGLLRPATPEDQTLLAAFFDRLSPQSRRLRFFSESGPTPEIIADLCANDQPARQQTLLVLRKERTNWHVVASGSYLALRDGAAEFAVAVDDGFQGKGIGGILLERLAVLAVAHGFTRFIAETHPTNKGMLDVFRSSGFQCRETMEDGLVHIELAVTPGEASIQHSDRRDRIFTKASIRPLFYPGSVAVVGASKEPGQIGRRILEGLIRQHFTGPVYPVNPNSRVVFSMKAYPTVQAIGEPVDLAILAVPHEQMPGVIQDCAASDVRAVIVVSTGYAETGDPEGRKRQDILLDDVRGAGMRMVGPNCLGVINADPEIRLHASFAPTHPKPGKLAVSSQSGALGLALLQFAKAKNLGLAQFISMGNKADVTGNDLLYFWEDEPRVGVILLYLESFGNPRRFSRIARHVSRRKPIICVKSGRHRASEQAALEERAVAGLFRQTGILRAETLESMMDIAALLSTQPLPGGRRVSILTNSHGAGVLSADACAAQELEVTGGGAFSACIEPDDYRDRAESLMNSNETDAVLVLHAPIHEDRSSEILAALARALANSGNPKPLIAVMLSDQVPTGVAEHDLANIPCCRDPETAAQALAASATYAAWLARPVGMIPQFDDVRREEALAAAKALPEFPEPHAFEVILHHMGISTQPGPEIPYPLTAGITQHPLFGPVLQVQEGGFIDHRIFPLTDTESQDLTEALIGVSRQISSAHRNALAELMLRLSLLSEEIPDLLHLTLRIAPCTADPEKLACTPIGVSMRTIS